MDSHMILWLLCETVSPAASQGNVTWADMAEDDEVINTEACNT